LLAVMTAVVGLHYLVANFLSLLLLCLWRFVVSDRYIWRPAAGDRASGQRPEPGEAEGLPGL
jgi:hypothetical protein